VSIWLLLALVCLLLVTGCVHAQAGLLGLGMIPMLRMGNTALWRHLADWRSRTDDRTQRLFALASAGVALFAVSGLAAVVLGLVAILS
jgi:hypothetical protein